MSFDSLWDVDESTYADDKDRGHQVFQQPRPGSGIRLGKLCNTCHKDSPGVRPDWDRHVAGTFAIDELRSNGIPLTEADQGAMGVTGKPEDRGRFKVPTIRNITLTGPYMHDGRMATLEEVVRHYDGHVEAHVEAAGRHRLGRAH